MTDTPAPENPAPEAPPEEMDPPEEAPPEEAPPEEPAPVTPQDDSIGQRIDQAVQDVRNEFNAKIDAMQGQLGDAMNKIDARQGQVQDVAGQSQRQAADQALAQQQPPAVSDLPSQTQSQ